VWLWLEGKVPKSLFLQITVLVAGVVLLACVAILSAWGGHVSEELVTGVMDTAIHLLAISILFEMFREYVVEANRRTTRASLAIVLSPAKMGLYG